MRRVPVVIGERFGRLIVTHDLGTSPSTGRKRTQARCTCDCGVSITAAYTNLKSGNTRSCGCLSDEHRRTVNYKHGLTRSPLYVVHDNMKARVSNPNHINYDRYGGRGISMCGEWREFSAFYQWAMDNGWKRGMQIDRIDNDGNYCPENCRFVTPEANQSNKSTSRRWFIDGCAYPSLSVASRELGVPSSTLSNWCNGYIIDGVRHAGRKNCYSEYIYPRNKE